MEKIVAICVGHSRSSKGRIEGGAVSIGKESEWSYNRQLAEMIADELGKDPIDNVVISKYNEVGYTAAQRWLAKALKDYRATVAIELHFNSSDDPKANGHEWLYWHSSKNAKDLAVSINDEMRVKVGEIKARGAKPRFPGDRGAEFLRGTHCPAIICEVGFGSNAGDWNAMTRKKVEIASAIARGIKNYLD